MTLSAPSASLIPGVNHKAGLKRAMLEYEQIFAGLFSLQQTADAQNCDDR